MSKPEIHDNYLWIPETSRLCTGYTRIATNRCPVRRSNPSPGAKGFVCRAVGRMSLVGQNSTDGGMRSRQSRSLDSPTHEL